jgi:hypothetical protein
MIYYFALRNDDWDYATVFLRRSGVPQAEITPDLLRATLYYREDHAADAVARLYDPGTFRPQRLPCVAPSVLAWRLGTIAAMSRGIRKSQRWADLGILADTLFDAGCDDDPLIERCRHLGQQLSQASTSTDKAPARLVTQAASLCVAIPGDVRRQVKP